METEQIGSEEPLQQLPWSLRKLASLERFHLHKVELFQNISRDPSFDVRYLPQNCGAFQMPCFWIPRRHFYVYGARTEEANELNLFAGHGFEERVLFPIHPTSLDSYRSFLSAVAARDAAGEGLRIWAAPTSSTRTLLAWPDQEPEKAVFIKTSLHSPIFGDRRLYLSKVARSVGLSRLVHESGGSLPCTLRFFPEPFGFVPRAMQDSGVIVRSIPREIREGDVLAAPLFSMVGGNENNPPLLLAMVEHGGIRPLQFVEETLCASFARLWLELTMGFGLIVEAHGQDLMLALSQDLAPLGNFFYRDFEGLQVDWALRDLLGLPAPRDMPRASAWYETYATWGYRYTDFAWYKSMISLQQYLHLVLNELDHSLREWRERGLITGPMLENDHVTMMFSRHMLGAIEQMFGVKAGPEYNVYHSLKRFAIFLSKVRREAMTRGKVPMCSPLLPDPRQSAPHG